MLIVQFVRPSKKTLCLGEYCWVGRLIILHCFSSIKLISVFYKRCYFPLVFKISKKNLNTLSNIIVITISRHQQFTFSAEPYFHLHTNKRTLVRSKGVQGNSTLFPNEHIALHVRTQKELILLLKKISSFLFCLPKGLRFFFFFLQRPYIKINVGYRIKKKKVLVWVTEAKLTDHQETVQESMDLVQMNGHAAQLYPFILTETLSVLLNLPKPPFFHL